MLVKSLCEAYLRYHPENQYRADLGFRIVICIPICVPVIGAIKKDRSNVGPYQLFYVALDVLALFQLLNDVGIRLPVEFQMDHAELVFVGFVITLLRSFLCFCCHFCISHEKTVSTISSSSLMYIVSHSGYFFK